MEKDADIRNHLEAHKAEIKALGKTIQDKSQSFDPAAPHCIRCAKKGECL